MVLMTIGEVPAPETNSEFTFVIVDLLSGVLIIATVVGNIGSMIANTNAMRSDFQHRFDAIKTYLAIRAVGYDQSSSYMQIVAPVYVQYVRHYAGRV